MQPAQLVIAAAAVLFVAWNNRDKLQPLVARFLPKLTAAPPTAEDETLERVRLALELRKKCAGACPEALKHLELAFAHLLPGHVEGAP